MMRRLAAIAAAATLLAQAQSGTAQSTNPQLDWIIQRTSQGCIYFLQRQDVEVMARDGWAFSWAPACRPGQPIDGAGVMHGTKPNTRWDRDGVMVNGYWNGPQVRHSLYYEQGAWVSDPEMDGTSTFVMGCLDFENEYGCRRAPAGGGFPIAVQAPRQAPAQAPAQQIVAPPRSAPATGSASSSAAAGHIHNPANEASKCVTIVTMQSMAKGSRAEFANNCAWTVWVQWPGGLEDIAPGESYPTMQTTDFLYYACRKDPRTGGGLYQTAAMAQQHVVICDAK